MSKHLHLAAVVTAFLLISVCFAAEKWSQIGRDAQNTKRSSYSSPAPASWVTSLTDQEFVIGSYFDSFTYFAVDGDSGTLYLSLQSYNWATTTVFALNMQDGAIKKQFSFETKCDFKQCPFSLAYGKNHVLSAKTGDVVTEYQSKKAGATYNTIGLAGFSFADEGKLAWKFDFDSTVAGAWQVSEPSAITSDDCIIFAQNSDPNGYSLSAVEYLQKDSAPVWNIQLDNAATAPAVDSNDNVYVNYNKSCIMKVDGKTGHILSTTDSLPTGFSFQLASVKPAVGVNRVYQVARNSSSTFFAVAYTNEESFGANQKLIWTTQLEVSNPGGQPFVYPYYCSSPVVAPNTQGHNGDETVLVNCYHPNGTIAIVYALNGKTGEQVWSTEVARMPANMLVCNSVALSTSGKYLVLSCVQMIKGNSQVVVLETAGGKVVNSFTRQQTYRNFMFLDSDNYVYFGYQLYNSQTQKSIVKVEKKPLLEPEGPSRMNVKHKRTTRN